MIYKGINFSGPRQEVLVIPRNGIDVIITADAVYNFAEFDAILSPPKVPLRQKAGSSEVEQMHNDPEYQKKLDKYIAHKSDWIVLKSLQATKELEWETVDLSDPETWANYKTELVSAGFSQLEIMNIISLINRACGLDQDKIDEATKSFLASRQEEPRT